MSTESRGEVLIHDSDGEDDDDGDGGGGTNLVTLSGFKGECGVTSIEVDPISVDTIIEEEESRVVCKDDDDGADVGIIVNRLGCGGREGGS